MLAPHLAEQLHEAARLINTAAGPRGGQHRPDQLDTAASLSRQFPDRQLASATAQTLEQVHALRDDLSALWDQVASDVQPAVVQDHLNALVESHGPVRLQLEQPEESTQTGPDDATPAGARPAARWVLGKAHGPAVDRFTRELVMAVAETAVAGELHRLKVCSGTDCSNALVDATRNSSKQFCDEANCANRTHVRAYRERQASSEAPPTRKSSSSPSSSSASSSSSSTPASAAARTPDSAPSSARTQEAEASPSSGISRKIRTLSARLQDPELSKKDRKKVVKKFKKLRKKLKDSADVELLERLAPDVKK